jgi:PKD repeat protein
MSGVFQEIEFNPADSNTMYFIRQVSDSTEFYKSIDGGISLIQKKNGWPVPSSGDEQKRVEIATTPAAPHKIWALATGKANGSSGLFGIYISTDEGESWTFACCGPQPGGLASTTNINMMGWADDGTDDGGQYYYDLALEVEDTDSNVVHVAGVNHWVSYDGGITFTCPAKWSHPDKPMYVHADIHDIHSYGEDLWFACDGGIFYSDDKGDTIERRMFGIQGTDFWGFGAGYWDGEVMVGGTYHNGTLLKDNQVYNNDWLSTQGGDNIRGFVNPGNERVVYHDGGAKMIPGDRSLPITGLPFSRMPNASYIVGESSNIAFDQNNYSRLYSGEGTSLWLSNDNGNSFVEVHDFGEEVAEIQVSPADADRIYVCTYKDWWATKRIWRTEDAGVSWTDITPNLVTIPSDRWVPYNIAVDAKDPDKLWLARTSQYGNNYPNMNGEQVFVSTDGGNNWSSLSTATIDNESITNMFHQHGTLGGIYLGTRRAVYYRNDTMSDWALFANQLPARTFSRLLVPYYREGKLRNAGNRGVWEAEFYEQSTPIARIAADRTSSYCLRDTVTFVDHSVLHGDSASWLWSFPGGIPTASTDRNPKVVYTSPGTYDVSLTVSDKFGTDSSTMTDFIGIENECGRDTIPGFAMQCTSSGDFANVPTFPLNSNTLTLSAWIKPDQPLPDYTAFVMARQHAAGINIRPGMELGYHWPNGSWSWSSGLFVPEGHWSHVALVVTPDSIRLYLNGVGSTHIVSVDSGDFRGGLDIGSYRGWASRNFYGAIDEVCIWDRALSQKEIRESMHLTKNPSADVSLIGYYQFNRAAGQVTDRVALNHANLTGGASRVASTAPAGGGNSYSRVIDTPGSYLFGSTGISIDASSANWTGGYADLVISRINLHPDQLPTGLHVPSRSYWVIRNYGDTVTNYTLDMSFDKIGDVTAVQQAADLHLWNRVPNGESATWGNLLAYGSIFSQNTDGSVIYEETFAGSFGQYVIEMDGAVSSALEIDKDQLTVYPNPAKSGHRIRFTSPQGGRSELTIYDVNGHIIAHQISNGLVQINTTNWESGIYLYQFESLDSKWAGTLVID